MWNMIWPVGLVVLANVLYNICTKSTPTEANAFLSLTITYLVAAGVSALLFWADRSAGGLGSELKQLNWTSLVLGVCIIGLEFGYICIYRAGWPVSMGSLVANLCLACVLVVVGVLLYKEVVTLRQILGLVVCGAGLVLLSR